MYIFWDYKEIIKKLPFGSFFLVVIYILYIWFYHNIVWILDWHHICRTSVIYDIRNTFEFSYLYIEPFFFYHEISLFDFECPYVVPFGCIYVEYPYVVDEEKSYYREHNDVCAGKSELKLLLFYLSFWEKAMCFFFEYYIWIHRGAKRVMNYF